MSNSFTIEGYLVLEGHKVNNYSNQFRGSIVKVTKGKPGLTARQLAVKINITVPNIFFERTVPVLNIELPQDSVAYPNPDTVVKLSALEIADKLQLEVTDIEDGLRTLINKKIPPPGETIEGVKNG